MRQKITRSHIFKGATAGITGIFKQGISPKSLALAIATGVCLGIIPVLGVTSLLCSFASLRWKLNMVVIQTINYLVYPLQLILYIPFLKYGDTYLGTNTFHYTLTQITDRFRTDTWGTVEEFAIYNLFGIIVWLVTSPVFFLLLYGISYSICKSVLTSAQQLKKESPDKLHKR